MNHDPRLPDLPHDIITTGILARLPSKSLCRFKCVSKLWNATINDPVFVKSHIAQNYSPSSSILGLYCYRSKDPKKCLFDFFTKDRAHYFAFKTSITTQLVGHSNGLFCFVCDNLIALLNPSTGVSLTHPLPPPPPPDHPIISYGFGFDPSADEYKAVQVVHAKRGLYRCMVYTFGAQENSWRNVTVPVNLSHRIKWRALPEGGDIGETVNKGKALCVNATLFWFFRRPHLFMVFDLHAEDFRFFEGPIPEPDLCDFLLNNACRCFLIDWQGSMCLAFQSVIGNTVHLYIYNSKSPDADGWRVKRVDIQTKFTYKNGALALLRHNALAGDSIFYSFRGRELVLSTEGCDGRFYDLAGSEMATKFPIPLGMPQGAVLEYLFAYDVKNLLCLKTLRRSLPTRIRFAPKRMPLGKA